MIQLVEDAHSRRNNCRAFSATETAASSPSRRPSSGGKLHAR
jgi:hypothetical protein